MPDRMKVVVNADDLGRSVEVTDAIMRHIRAGSITSSSLLATGPDFARSASLARAHPEASFGVHLNATEFAPLTSDPRMEIFLLDGSFTESSRKFWRRPGALAALIGEFSAQYETVAEHLPVTHVDTHHMIHWRPEFLPVMRTLVKRHRIPRVRGVTLHDARGLVGIRRRAWRRAMLSRTNVRMTDDFDSLRGLLAASPDSVAGLSSIEVMVHPGHPGFSAETELLSGPWADRMDRPMDLVSYHHI